MKCPAKIGETHPLGALEVHLGLSEILCLHLGKESVLQIKGSGENFRDIEK